MRYHPTSHRIGHTIRWWTEPCSQDRIRTCNNTTFMTSRIQELMDRGVFRVWYHFHITHYLTYLSTLTGCSQERNRTSLQGATRCHNLPSESNRPCTKPDYLIYLSKNLYKDIYSTPINQMFYEKNLQFRVSLYGFFVGSWYLYIKEVLCLNVKYVIVN